MVEEHGKKITGGEAQRIVLSLCLAKGFCFGIFDENAAHLDNRSAAENQGYSAVAE